MGRTKSVLVTVLQNGEFHSSARTASRSSLMWAALMTVVPGTIVGSVEKLGADLPNATAASVRAVRSSVIWTRLTVVTPAVTVRSVKGKAAKLP